MLAHPDAELVQENGVLVLHNLSLFGARRLPTRAAALAHPRAATAANVPRIRAAGAKAVVEAALERFPNLKSVKKYAPLMLARLA